ncbi:MAG: hypothetical protein J0L64_22270 [Acidobacteria bacterium]|nr:hypothetical protein [Acidobacteriota bacterium]
MPVPEEHRAEIERFPPVLLALILAELAAGNHIMEIGHTFPAAPVGAYVLLNAPVTTRPRAKDADIDFYDYGTSHHSGRFTDKTRHFFVLEPPHPPPPPPDMDAIRAAMNPPPFEPVREYDSTLYERFRKSMWIDYDKWREGEGYDLDAIRQADKYDVRGIERLVLQHSPRDWRDVEAMAALGTENCIAEMKAILKGRDFQLKQAVEQYAPELVTKKTRTATLVKALNEGVIYGGLTQALDTLPEFHPPEAMKALFRGALSREGDVAVHFAAMLYYLHGKAKVPFDWDHRPFFLEFHAPVGPEREALFRELCARIGVDPTPYLKAR